MYIAVAITTEQFENGKLCQTASAECKTHTSKRIQEKHETQATFTGRKQLPSEKKTYILSKQNTSNSKTAIAQG